MSVGAAAAVAAPVDPDTEARAAGETLRATLAHVSSQAELGRILRNVVALAIAPRVNPPPPTTLEKGQKWLKDHAVTVTAATTLGGTLAVQTGALPYLLSGGRAVAEITGRVLTTAPVSMTINGAPVDISLLSGAVIAGASYMGLEGAIKCGKVLLDNKLVTGLTIGVLAMGGYTVPILGAVLSSGVWKPVAIGAAVKYRAPLVKLIRDPAAGWQQVKDAGNAASAAVATRLQQVRNAGPAVSAAVAGRWQQVRNAGTAVGAGAWQLAGRLRQGVTNIVSERPRAATSAGVVAAAAAGIGLGLLSAPVAIAVAVGVPGGLLLDYLQK